VCLVYHQMTDEHDRGEREDDQGPRDGANHAVTTAHGDRNHISPTLHPVHGVMALHLRQGRASIINGPTLDTEAQLQGVCLIDARDVNDALWLATTLSPSRLGWIEVPLSWRPSCRDRAAPSADAGRSHPIDWEVASTSSNRSPLGGCAVQELARATIAVDFTTDAPLRAILNVPGPRLARPAALWIEDPQANRVDIKRDSHWPIPGAQRLRPIERVAGDEDAQFRPAYPSRPRGQDALRGRSDVGT
jgi:hypothetical protein